MARDNFIFHEHFYNAIRELPEELRFELYDAMFDYIFLDMECDDNSPAVKAMITMIEAQIDQDDELNDWDAHVECVCGHESVNAEREVPENSECPFLSRQKYI